MDAAERAALEAFARAAPIEPWDGVDERAWVGFGLRCLLEAGRELRARSRSLAGVFERKGDGSPATALEREVEAALRARLARFAPDAAFVGEEHGGSMPAAGFTVAVDPVDGTWAMLSETPSWCCAIAVVRDGAPFAGFVANPVTGELAYALHEGPARELRLSAFGEPPSARTLPAVRAQDAPPLVHLHPSAVARELSAALFDAWRAGELAVVRSAGGSPTWALIEAARGHGVYLNAWGPQPAEPFDLVAGVLIVRAAGGDVLDAEGHPIDATSHAGPWLAGIDRARCAALAARVRAHWPA